MTIDARQLRYFVAVAEEHHFGRAAARLQMAQPPLSKQIRQLEIMLGTDLLVRTTRKVELNAAGEMLLVRGRRIIEELQTLESDVKRVGNGLEGVLRLGFTGSATYGMMPRIVREAAAAFPRVSLSVSGESLTPSLTTALVEHRIDIALLRPPMTSDVIAHSVVAHEKLVVALPAHSKLTERDTLTFEELARENFVGYPPDSVVATIIAEEWRRRDLNPHIVQTVKETSTLLSLVAAGMGVAFVPESAMSLTLQGASFRTLDDAPGIDLALAWRRDDLSAAVHNFIPFMERVIRESPGDQS